MQYFLVFLAGVFLALQQSINGELGNYIPLTHVVLIEHVVGGLCIFVYLKFIKKEKLKLGPMPVYLYSAGLFGYVLVFLTSYTIVHIGATLTTCLSIAGQVVASVVIDHFDLFHIKRVPFNSKRIIPLLLIITGVIIANMG